MRSKANPRHLRPCRRPRRRRRCCCWLVDVRCWSPLTVRNPSPLAVLTPSPLTIRNPKADAEIDLLSAENGGVEVACSDQHYGVPKNMIKVRSIGRSALACARPVWVVCKYEQVCSSIVFSSS